MRKNRLEKRIKNSVLVRTASIVIFCCTSLFAYANEEIQVKVATQVEYSKEKKEQSSKQLILKFKQTAIKKLMNEMPQAKFKLMQQHFDELTSPDLLDRFVTRVRVASADCEVLTGANCGTVKGKSLEIKGIAYVNMTAIDQFITDQTTSSMENEIENEFAILFIARKVSSEKIFDEKRTQVFQEKSTSESEVIEGSDDTSIVQGTSGSETQVLKSGGSKEFKLEQYSYEIDMAATDRLGNAVVEKLVDSGFEPLSVDDYVEDYDIPYLDELVESGNFGEDGTLDRRTMNAIKKATSEDGIKFLGVGRIDYRLPEKNDLTGNLRIPAIVTVEVFMARGRRMRTVASVSPQLVYGEYESTGDRTIGETRAQNDAVSLAMDTIVSQLQSKGLR